MKNKKITNKEKMNNKKQKTKNKEKTKTFFIKSKFRFNEKIVYGIVYEDMNKNIEKIEQKNENENNENKNKYGEFFTPDILIEEILDNLPQRVWKDPSLKWLDPCAGTGNFFILVNQRLMKSLENVIPDSKDRQTHIHKNMLYCVELNKINVDILKQTFPYNVTQGDFLSESLSFSSSPSSLPSPSSSFPKHTFDVILENPPYQKMKENKYAGAKGNFTLWDKFVKKSLEILNPHGGVIGAITPANWRRPEHPLYPLITPHLTYLHIYDKKKGLEYFGAQTRFDIYVLSLSTPSSSPPRNPNPIIKDEKNIVHRNIHPKDWPFFPNYNYEIIQKRLLPKNKRRTKVLYDSNKYNSKNLSKKRTPKYKYPIVHTMTKKGLGVRYSSSLKKGHIGTPKVILNFNENQYPYNDWKGEYGLSQISFAIPVKNKKEGERIVKEINSPEFKEIINATKWGSFQTDRRMFEYLRI